MKWLPLLVALVATPGWGGEVEPATTVRARLHLRIKETLPPQPPAPAEPPADEPVFVLEPIVVTESRAVIAFEKQLADEKARLDEAAFSLRKGGTLFHGDRLDLGIWGRVGGWEFLRIKW
jgi:hypothetical protein